MKDLALEYTIKLEEIMEYLPDNKLLEHLEKVSTELKKRNSLLAVNTKEVSIDALKSFLDDLVTNGKT